MHQFPNFLDMTLQRFPKNGTFRCVPTLATSDNNLIRQTTAGFCPRWVVLGGSALHSAVPPWSHTNADPLFRHSKNIEHETGKPLMIFFYLSNIIDHYSVKFSTTMRTLLATGNSVKYDIHFLKPKFQKLSERYDPGPTGTRHSGGPEHNPATV